MKNAIGIIGGMGPMASQLFYKMVTEHTAAGTDQEHLNLVLLSDASMPDRTTAILEGNYEEVCNQMLDDALLLEKCGCRAVAVTCHTAHFFVDMIADRLQIPVIHMVQTAADAVKEQCPGEQIGIMATDGTLRTGLYQKALTSRGLRPFTPSEEVQKEVMYQIYGRVKNGQPYDERSWERIAEEYRNAGCGKVMLCCTELSVIKVDAKLSDWYVDPMEKLAEKVIEFAGKEYV